MSAAAPDRRRWLFAVGLGAGALFLPAALPLLAGPLRGHAHCIETYLSLAPVLPGFTLASLVSGFANQAGIELPPPGDLLDGAAGWAAVVAVQAALLVGVSLLARRKGRGPNGALVVVAVTMGFLYYGIAALIRA